MAIFNNKIDLKIIKINFCELSIYLQLISTFTDLQIPDFTAYSSVTLSDVGIFGYLPLINHHDINDNVAIR